MRPQPQLARQLGGGSALPGEPQGVRAQGQGDRRAVVGRRRGGRVMIHAVAEGLCSELGRGRLPRPNAWRARVRGWICRPTLRWLVLQATVCVCVKCVCGSLFGCFSARRVGALRFRRAALCSCSTRAFAHLRTPEHQQPRHDLALRAVRAGHHPAARQKSLVQRVQGDLQQRVGRCTAQDRRHLLCQRCRRHTHTGWRGVDTYFPLRSKEGRSGHSP